MANGNHQRSAPPIPFLTAVWAGMSREEIKAGLRNGDIVRPGRPPDWLDEGTDPGPAGPEGAIVAGPPASADRARVNSWFKSLDPDLQPPVFEKMWNGAGSDDSERATNLTSYLSRLLVTRDPAEASADASGTDDAARLDSILSSGEHHAKVVDLGGKTGADLAALADTDIGYRYALVHLDAFAMTESEGLFAGANVDGALDRIDADTGATMFSDAWLGDRGKFLAWKLSGESGAAITVEGAEDWTFIDRGIKDADGKPLALEIKASEANARQNQLVFGTADDEVFKGVSGSDRVYAGAGDDVLRGGRGSDRLEGGDGDDLVMGGAGNDEIAGGRGNDELDGGGGNDRLEGGSGDDAYVIHAGDGADTIVDADGVGSIELDGDALQGTMQAGGDKWTSADEKVEFTFDGDLQTGGTLTISSFADGASHEGPAQNTITVNDWKNGDLGITLGDEIDALQPAENDASVQVSSGPVGEGATETRFDFDAALESLLGNGSPMLRTIDRASYQRGIEASSAVLEPPDISAAVNFGDSAVLGAVTEAAMADALAADYASDSFDSFEPTQMRAIPNVDVASLMELKQAGLEVRGRAGA